MPVFLKTDEYHSLNFIDVIISRILKSSYMKTLILYLFIFISSTILWQSSLAQNYSLSFDGTNDYVSLPSSVQPSGSNFTAEAWVYLDPAGLGDQKILMNLTWSGGAKGFGMNIYNDGLGYYFNGSVYLSGSSYFTPSSGFIPVNTWTHIAMTWQVNGNVTAYLNGILVGSTSTGTGTYTSSGVTTFMGSGNNAGWAPFKGKIDEVRIWNTTRSQAEISANMLTNLVGNESGLAAYFSMSNGSGTSLTDDKIGGTNSGTLNNGVAWTTNSILPLRFVSFAGQSKGPAIQLNWTTADQISNSYFEIQRSTDGIHFSAIAFTDSKKYSGNEQQYSYSDELPLNGINYYRLKQVDIDGRYSFSATISVSSKGADKIITTYTNPVTNSRLQLRLKIPSLISIYQASGALLYQKKLEAGMQEINVAAFPKGYYLIKANNEVLKLLIQ